MIELLLVCALAGLMQAVRAFAGGNASGGTELAFGYLLLAAFFSARVIGRLRLPRLTGYLLAGVVSGPFVLKFVSVDMTSSLKVVSDVATCILGLTAGGELNLKRVKPLMRTLRAITVSAICVGMVLLSAAVFALRPLLPMFDGLDFNGTVAVSALVGIALTAQSPAVVMALISETRADGPLSQLILACVVVSDLVVVVAYSVVAAITGAVTGASVDVLDTAREVAWELFGSMAFGVLIGVVLAQFLRHVDKGATMFALMICVVVAEIGSRVHLDPLVVMLAAGVWLENFARGNAGKLLHGFESAELPVFLVFFALAGCKLNIDQLQTLIVPVAVLAFLRAAIFFVGGRRACARTGAAPAAVSYGWAGLVPQAGLSLALVAVIQQNFPTFGPQAAVLLLSVVGVNQLIAPVILRIALVQSGESGKRAVQAFAADH
jgi:Kef-type K+ transport system membrane component KefB